jgi:hypothetical protein
MKYEIVELLARLISVIRIEISRAKKYEQSEEVSYYRVIKTRGDREWREYTIDPVTYDQARLWFESKAFSRKIHAGTKLILYKQSVNGKWKRVSKPILVTQKPKR